jgi:D-threo-aldose 1-dehydrogenase
MINKLKNKKYRLGRTEILDPPIGFGCAPLGHPAFTPITDDQAVEVIQRAIQMGINLFDTAPGYGAGLSEQRLGLGLTGIPRDQFIIETKLGLLQENRRIRFDFSYDGIMLSLEESLARLKLDYVDILLIHDPDYYYEQALYSAFPVLASLREQGVVKAIGVGMNQWQMLADFAQNADFDVFMLAHRYTLLEQSALNFLDICVEKQISVHLAGIYNSGILATGAKDGAKYIYRDAPTGILERVCDIQTICEKYEVPIRAAALQFAWAHPAISSLVIGMSLPEEVYDNLGAFVMPIPGELWEDLIKAGLILENVPIPT